MKTSVQDNPAKEDLLGEGSTDRTLTLEDRRVLGYGQYGDPLGWPVFYFHGFPGSRLEWPAIDPDDRASALSCRILAVDRPGIGRSTPKPRRGLLDWPSDVEALADALGIERFSVLGLSGGGPFAAACAHQLPDRVSAASIVSGMGPPDAPGVRDGLAWAIPGKPWPLRLALLKLIAISLRGDPRTFLTRGKKSVSPPDQHLLDDPAFIDGLSGAMTEAFRQGIAGAAHDAAIYRTAWGFQLRDIACPVHLWHGGRDQNVPISVARHVAAALTRCEATFLEDEGHFSLVPRILDDVLSTSARVSLSPRP